MNDLSFTAMRIILGLSSLGGLIFGVCALITAAILAHFAARPHRPGSAGERRAGAESQPPSKAAEELKT